MSKMYDLTKTQTFFEKTGTALTAFSIFLFIFFEIVNTPYIDTKKTEHALILAILLGLVIGIGFFIFKISQKYEVDSITALGLVVLMLPFMLFSVLNNEVRQNITNGWYLLTFLISIVVGILTISILLTKIKNKFDDILTYILFLLGLLIFLILQDYTISFKQIYNLSLLIPWEILKSAILGLEIGFYLGVISIPILFFLDKLYNKIVHCLDSL